MKIVDNANPKKNPITNIFGYIILALCAMMYFVRYILPAVYTLKQEVTFEWYIPIVPAGIGLFLIFINDVTFTGLLTTVSSVLTNFFTKKP